MQVSDRGAQFVSKGEVEPRHTKEKTARSLKMVRRSQLCRGIIVSSEPGIELVKLRWNSVETVRSWCCIDGVTKSVFAHLILRKELTSQAARRL